MKPAAAQFAAGGGPVMLRTRGLVVGVLAAAIVAVVPLPAAAEDPVPAPTVLELSVGPSSIGFPVSLTAELRELTPTSSNPVAFELIRFTVTAPDGTVTVVGPAFTGLDGTAVATFTPPGPGTYQAAAFYDGFVLYAPSFSSIVPFTPSQRVRLVTSAPPGAVAGAAVELTATLHTLPQGEPLNGMSVTLDPDGFSSQTRITVDGAVSMFFVPITSGPYTFTASFTPFGSLVNHDGNHAVETSTATFSVERADTRLDPLVLASIDFVGDAIVPLTVLRRTSAPTEAVSGAEVNFSVRKLPGGTPATSTDTTDVNGQATTTHTFTASGSHVVEASYAGSPALNSSVTSQNVDVFQKTQLTYDGATSGVAGAPLQLRATLTPVPGVVGIAGQTVTFTVNGQSFQALTDTAGRATVNYTPPDAGTYNVVASFFNPADFFANRFGALAPETSAATITVASAITVLAPLNLPATELVGNTIAPQTVLTRITPPAGPAAFHGVNFLVREPGGTTALSSDLTDTNGLASTTYTFTRRGNHVVEATFDGSASLSPTFAFDDVDVFQRTQLTYDGATSGVAGAPLELAATLTAVPSGVTVAGQTVMFTVNGQSFQVLTDIAGRATLNYTPPDVGTYSVVASFANVVDFFANRFGDLAPETSAAAITVTPGVQRVRAVANPVTATAGAPVELTVTLQTDPQGEPLDGVPFTFTVVGSGFPSTMTGTTVDGVARATYTPTDSDGQTFTAVFELVDPYVNHDGNHAPETVTTTFSAERAVATFSSVSVTSGTSYVFEAITLQATLSRVSAPAGPVNSTSVVFVVTEPEAATIQIVLATTNGLGVASATFVPRLRGAHIVKATFAGDPALLPATSAPANLNVYQKTFLTYDGATSGAPGAPLALAATLRSVPQNQAVPGQTVTFTVTGPGGTTVLPPAVTNPAGRATANYTPATAGAYNVEASFANPAGFFTNAAGAVPPLPTTATANITVATVTQPTVITYAGATTGHSLETLALAATLRTSSGAPLAGKSLRFTVTAPGGVVWTKDATTNAAGRASINYTPLLPGKHTVVVSFAGAAGLNASSTTVQVPVTARTTLTYTGDASGRVNRAVTLSTTLRTGTLGLPVPGQNVVFKVTRGSTTVQLTARTDALGRAKVTFVPTVVGTYAVLVSFAGNNDLFLDPATTNASVVVRN